MIKGARYEHGKKMNSNVVSAFLEISLNKDDLSGLLDMKIATLVR